MATPLGSQREALRAHLHVESRANQAYPLPMTSRRQLRTVKAAAAAINSARSDRTNCRIQKVFILGYILGKQAHLRFARVEANNTMEI